MAVRARLSLLSLPLPVLVVAMPPVAHAQQAEPRKDAENSEEIVVTAARTMLPPNALPLTIDVIDKQRLDQQIAISGSVTDAVANLTPSFSPTRQKLSGAGETLRGRSPLYAINGIPQSTPMRDGSRDGFTIDGFFVDRVELIYGSNALQGIGGTGGIVNQVTVGAPKTDGVSGRVLLQGTADNDFRSDGIGGKAAGLVQWKSGRFDASFGAAYEKRGVFYDGDGRRVGLNLTQGETQDSTTVSLFSRIGYQVGDTGRIDLIASRFELKGGGNYVAVPGNRATGLPTSAIRGDAPGKPATSRTESVALTYTDRALGGGNFVGQIFFNRTHDTFGGEIAPIATFQDPRLDPTEKLFDQSENRSRKLGAKLSYERAVPGFEALTATLGFDALIDKTEQRLIATGRIWVPPSDFRSLAPFAQANLKLFGGKLRLAGGARYENVEIRIDDYHTLASTTYVAPNKATYGGVAVSGGKPRFEDLLFNGGVIVEPVAGIRAYASYAEGFTVPDIGRITRAIKVPGVDLDNYLDISPIVSNNREIGVEAKRGPLDASVTYFWSSSDKGQLLIARASGIFDVQRQRVEIEGLEVNLGVKLPVPGLKASIGYAHLKGRYDADTVPDGKVDTDLDGTNISPDRVNLAADYASGPFSARVQTQFYLSRRFDGKARTIDDANPLHPQKLFMNDFGGYVLTDAYVRYQTGLGGLSLSVTNLFDKMYIDYSSDTRLPNDNTVFYAGRGRTFTLGWDYRF
ncbi:TonB-dependent receptor [Sphingomonas sp. CBMAI 2297]|uniref:TonB-dependent receptor n=1 Tax=Sphingomonas sp. CBMAI 2297 TaxID=2991720 RepID=UPI002458953B|nr:TonB-dependent receptor [Sphingomonas sp. CBMAI 2297]MDH4745192.1 TonB-dependent receptor [Sphingomonas sp. CBMAI 2297]